MSRLWKTHHFLFRARRERCTQFGLGLLIAATTANTVAVFRTFPEIVISASVTGGYCSASLSRRALTPWRSSTSLTIASKPTGIPLFERNLKSGRISDVTSCNVMASPTTRTSSPNNWVMRIIPASRAWSASTRGRSSSRPCKEPSAATCTALRLGASALASVRARESSERKAATPASVIRGWRNLSQTPKAANSVGSEVLPAAFS